MRDTTQKGDDTDDKVDNSATESMMISDDVGRD